MFTELCEHSQCIMPWITVQRSRPWSLYAHTCTSLLGHATIFCSTNYPVAKTIILTYCIIGPQLSRNKIKLNYIFNPKTTGITILFYFFLKLTNFTWWAKDRSAVDCSVVWRKAKAAVIMTWITSITLNVYS